MGLATKSLQAIKHNYIGTVIRVGAQFIAQIIIMRELGPALVGVFGYALLMYGFLALVIDQGFGWSLVKGDFDDRRQIAIAFSRVMLAAILSAILVFAVSYPVEALLGNPLVGSVFRYSAPSYILIGMFVVAQARLRADLRFREIQIATTGSYLVAYPIVGVAMAFKGYGVWALLGAWYTQGLLQVAIAYYYNPHSVKLVNPLLPSSYGPLGRNVASINILNWMVEGASGIFIGSMGSVALGNFNAAAMIAKTPAQQLVQILQSILFSTAAALGNDRQNIKRLYLSAFSAIAFLVVPIYALGSSHASQIVQLIFGDKWLDAIDIFATLSPGVVAMALSSISGPILTATNGQKITLTSQIACLVALVIGLSLTTRLSLAYVGIAISVAYWIRLTIQLHHVAKNHSISAPELAATLRGPLVLAFVFATPIPEMTFLSEMTLRCVIAVGLCAYFPRFFISRPLVDVLMQLTVGRLVVRRFIK